MFEEDRIDGVTVGRAEWETFKGGKERGGRSGSEGVSESGELRRCPGQIPSEVRGGTMGEERGEHW